MQYIDLYYLWKEAFYKEGAEKEIRELGMQLSHHSFVSEHADKVLSGSSRLSCSKHDLIFENVCASDTETSDVLQIPDAEIHANKFFHYHIIKPVSPKKSKGVIIFFHGLNEKNWDKYLPWAYGLASRTGKAVLLFPIAFHMDRAPEIWSDRTQMRDIAEKRAAVHKDNTACSFVNAAISARLEEHPQRLFWSGLQTYSDVISLINIIKTDKMPVIDKNASIDLFGYSIGSFLSLILMMSNPDGVFTNSRQFCFCGGMTIDRMFPISKYIMDARSAISMQECFATLLSSDFITDSRLSHYQDDTFHYEESWFKTMLRYNYFENRRHRRFTELEKQIKAYCLKKDEVAPPIEALNTLKGGFREIGIEVQIEDFDFPYSHMVPFPLTKKNAAEVTFAYERFMKVASDFLR